MPEPELVRRQQVQRPRIAHCLTSVLSSHSAVDTASRSRPSTRAHSDSSALDMTWACRPQIADATSSARSRGTRASSACRRARQAAACAHVIPPAQPSGHPATLSGVLERFDGLPTRQLAGGLSGRGGGHPAREGARPRGLDALPTTSPCCIPRCRSVHTFHMRFPLDLVWLDAAGGPCGWTPPCRRAGSDLPTCALGPRVRRRRAPSPSWAPACSWRPAAAWSQPRRVAELAELGGVAPEQQVDRPVDRDPQPALVPGHLRQVVGAGQEPGRKAPPADLERLGDGLVAAHVDEHAERLVGERLGRAARERVGDVAGDRLALAHRVLGRRRAAAWPRAGSGTAAASPIAHTPSMPGDLAGVAVIDPAALAQRQAELGHDRDRLDAGRPAHRPARDRSSPDSTTWSARRASSVGRQSGSRCRGGAARREANSASEAEISGITRSRASTRMKRRPSMRQRG